MRLSDKFKKLAAEAGVNIFNWKEKVEYTPPKQPRREPEHDDDPDHLYNMAQKYFERLVAQDKLIVVLTKLLDEYDFEVEKWDTIQNNHEQEIQDVKTWAQNHIKEIRKEYGVKAKSNRNVRIGELHNKTQQAESLLRKREKAIAVMKHGHELQIAKYKRRIELLEKKERKYQPKPELTFDERLEKVQKISDSLLGYPKADAHKLRDMAYALHSLISEAKQRIRNLTINTPQL